MVSADAGVKQRRFSLEGEFYWRIVDDLRGEAQAGLEDLHDHGLHLQASAIVFRRALQTCAVGRNGGVSHTSFELNF